MNYDMDELITAFNTLNESEGVAAKLKKLKKVDSMLGRGMLQNVDLDSDLSDFMSSEITTSTGEMSQDESLFLKALKNSIKNPKNLTQVNQVFQKIDRLSVATTQGNPEQNNAFTNALIRQRQMAKVSLKDKLRKAQRAEEKFKSLNPDLFFENGIQQTYFSSYKAIYLPMGKLSFADALIAIQKKGNTNTGPHALGEPNGYEVDLNHLENVHSLGLNGSLTLRFTDNALVDVNGPDIFVFEMGKIEPTQLEISVDGTTWIDIGKIGGGVAEIDIEAYVQPNQLFYFVRLTDLNTKSGIPGADIDAVAAIGSALRLNLDSAVLFDTGKSVLKAQGKVAIEELSQQIAQLEQGKIIIEGHTDDIGNAASNQRLSMERAKSVSSVLKVFLSHQKFTYAEKGYGENRPIEKNNSAENRQKNRRVEILVIPQ